MARYFQSVKELDKALDYLCSNYFTMGFEASIQHSVLYDDVKTIDFNYAKDFKEHILVLARILLPEKSPEFRTGSFKWL